MNKLLIIGAGNVGGFLAYNIDEFGSYDVIGFLDDDASKWGKTFYGRKVLGGVNTIVEYSRIPDLNVVIGISSPSIRSIVVKDLGGYALSYPNFVAKNVWLSKEVNLGKGVILYPGVSVNYETKIGDFVIMNMNCAIGHNCTIEEYVSLAPGVNLGGFTQVDQGASLGIGVSTKQNIRIGEGAVVGGQSMLTKDVPAKSVFVGVPGRMIKPH